MIRRAEPADVPAIERLIADAFGKYVERIGKPPAPMTADYAEALDTSLVWVISESAGADPAVLAVLVTKARADHILLDTIAVCPQAQGKGYAAQLLSRAEADATDLGVPEVRLYTNEAMTENFEFYRKHGYTETARGDHEDYRRVFYSKRVEPPAPG